MSDDLSDSSSESMCENCQVVNMLSEIFLQNDLQDAQSDEEFHEIAETWSNPETAKQRLRLKLLELLAHLEGSEME